MDFHTFMQHIQDAEKASGAKVNRLHPKPDHMGTGVELIATQEEWLSFSRFLFMRALHVYTTRWNPFGHGYVYELYVSIEPLPDQEEDNGS